ncbi:MAG: ADP-ribosylglycohydrolase family protein, partial [Deltaproteobacteria bacterium]|nr:ADP-ribosylglycohydrolase family protein [Deltaproteobacteria bacterium]
MASAAGLAASDCNDAPRTAETLCSLTHDHAEGIRGARALAVALCMARSGESTRLNREKLAKKFYPLDFRISDVRSSCRFDATCGGTVPLAIECFLESTSFEEAVRSAASLGGDSPTLTSMAGALAGAYYGVPENLRAVAMGML